MIDVKLFLLYFCFLLLAYFAPLNVIIEDIWMLPKTCK